MSTPLVAIRADAGPAVGVGHVARCFTLARALREGGYDVLFLTRRSSHALVGKLVSPFRALSIGEPVEGDQRADAAHTLSALDAEQVRPEWLVVDHLALDERFERAMAARVHQVVAIDDLRERVHFASLLVSDSDEPFFVPSDCESPSRELTGPSYAMLGEQFMPHPVAHARAPFDLLVSYGGSDPTSETRKAVDALVRCKSMPSLKGVIGQATIVIGYAFSDAQRLEQLARAGGLGVIHTPASLAPLMRAADLILCAGGQTMTESLAVHRPCVVTTTAPNQRLGVRRMRDRGLIDALGDHDSVTDVTLADAISVASLGMDERRARMDAVPFDTMGASRIVDAMAAFQLAG